MWLKKRAWPSTGWLLGLCPEVTVTWSPIPCHWPGPISMEPWSLVVLPEEERAMAEPWCRLSPSTKGLATDGEFQTPGGQLRQPPGTRLWLHLQGGSQMEGTSRKEAASWWSSSTSHGGCCLEEMGNWLGWRAIWVLARVPELLSSSPHILTSGWRERN